MFSLKFLNCICIHLSSDSSQFTSPFSWMQQERMGKHQQHIDELDKKIHQLSTPLPMTSRPAKLPLCLRAHSFPILKSFHFTQFLVLTLFFFGGVFFKFCFCEVVCWSPKYCLLCDCDFATHFWICLAVFIKISLLQLYLLTIGFLTYSLTSLNLPWR